MDTRIDITLETDMLAVLEFIKRPEIWVNISSSNHWDPDFMPSNSSERAWISVKKEGSRIGIICIHHDNSYTLKMHPYLEKRSGRHCRKMMFAFYRWFLAEIPEQIIKVVVVIDETRKSVLNFAGNVGFVKEGVNRASTFSDNVIVDQIYFGITRDEMREAAKL